MPPAEGHGRPSTFETALAALRRRERSVSELVGWLGERGHPAADIDAAVTELTECGELDDERFAALFADDKRELSGWGPERIAAALRERGLDASLIERVSAEEREQQLDRAAALLTERRTPLGDDAERGRALGMLTRRGFDYELAYDAIRRAAAGGEAAEEAA